MPEFSSTLTKLTDAVTSVLGLCFFLFELLFLLAEPLLLLVLLLLILFLIGRLAHLELYNYACVKIPAGVLVPSVGV